MVTMTSRGTAVLTLPTETQIKIVREFAAPARLVWKAWTTPELIKRWWHANRGTVTSAEVDLRVGGKWRWVMVTTEGGFEVAFHGEYREIVPHERLVYTEVFEGAPDSGSLNTTALVEKDGRTTVTMLMQLENQSDRDAILATGMEAGMQDALDLLEQLAVSLA
jgi:uncharacterized protein YndB with AHSA1/START domain